MRETLDTLEPPDTLPELCEVLSRALVERPPVQPKEGAIFQASYDSTLGELQSLCETGAADFAEAACSQVVVMAEGPKFLASHEDADHVRTPSPSGAG